VGDVVFGWDPTGVTGGISTTPQPKFVPGPGESALIFAGPITHLWDPTVPEGGSSILYFGLTLLALWMSRLWLALR
jgi:hypothetical protein